VLIKNGFGSIITVMMTSRNADDHANEISVTDLNDLLAGERPPVVIDVREPHEYEIVNIGGHLIPLRELPDRMNEVPTDRDVIVHCHHGGRSQRAIAFLKQNGFTRLKNLSGGIDAWAVQVDPSLPRY
jgi:sulfur-carrier protein adenylyltransferase/sulfurtransferase